ncbi:MAG: hypothetical protein ACXWQO_04575 [Bdellovibrionota bacterium]
MPKKKILLVELNEFNTGLFEAAAKAYGLKNIQTVCSWQKTDTLTEDTYDSGFLEPWSQWVSIHTGKNSLQHRINHLGDVPNMDFPQVWESLGSAGISSGIWGVMNGSRRDTKNCAFFVPDPWTFSENAYPRELNNFLGLLRYAAQNYTSMFSWRLFREALRFGICVLKEVPMGELLSATEHLVRSIFKYGPKNFVFFMAFEELSAALFLERRKKHRPDFQLVFLNTIAHIQHHYWTDANSLSPQLRHGFETVDRILGKIFASRGSDEAVLLLNGLSQMNSNHETPWILYRPISLKKFLQAAKLPDCRVEPLMSYDAHIFFSDAKDTELARSALESATVDGKKLFFVEADPTGKSKLFIRVDYTDEAAPRDFVEINGLKVEFARHFKGIVRRTGKHIPQGAIYASGLKLPEKMMNHELPEKIVNYFGISQGLASR